MPTINERKGVNSFDRSEKGDPGTGATLKREGTEDKPYDPGLFARLIDVSWGTHSTVTGQFICVGYSLSGSRLLATADTNVDESGATTVLNRGWITTFNTQVFIYQFGANEPVDFDVAMRVPLFGHDHVLIASGNTRQLVGHTTILGLVVCSLDNGKTWTDLRFPDFDPVRAYTVNFLAWDPTARVMYAASFPQIFGLGTDGIRLYKFTPGSSPTVAGIWTLVDHTLFGPDVPPTSGFPAIPHVLPAGSWIINDTTYYDNGLGGYNYWGINDGFGWYLGKVVFTGSDGKEHTLESPAGSGLSLDGGPLPFDDPRFIGPNTPTAGNGLIVATARRLFDPPDFTGPVDATQTVLVGTADLGVTWEQISPTDITPDFFYISCAFGKNKL